MPDDRSCKERILVVDDALDNLKVLRRMLVKHSYHVQPAITGELALRAISSSPPDLILLDIVMPGMDGFEICQRLKADDATRDIPVIFISAMDDAETKLKGFEHGAVDYICKPFQAKEVLARVHTHLALRSLRQQLQQQNALLKEQNTRFRILEEAAFEGIVIHERGTILEVNEAFVTMFGSSRQAMLGNTLLHCFDPDSHALIQQQLDHPDELPHELLGRREDDSRFPLQAQARSMPYEGRIARVCAVRDLTRQRQLEQENRTLRATLSDQERLGPLVGKSLAMQKVYARILSAAQSDETVMLYGETGVGKELAARAIFQLSEQHNQKFLPVNCGALQESLFEAQFFGHRKGAFTGAQQPSAGFFEKARGGTLFLDEVGELSLTMQAKLLRVLNDGEYTPLGANTPQMADVRIIAATNRELRDMVQTGAMREDFFHRLHVIALDIPPLRQRKDDIPLLVAHFLAQYVASHPQAPPDIPVHILNQFLEYEWPGNVRELFNELRRYLTLEEVELRNTSLPASQPDTLALNVQGKPFNDVIETVERTVLRDALRQTEGNKKAAAHLLQMPIMTLRRKIEKYGLG